LSFKSKVAQAEKKRGAKPPKQDNTSLTETLPTSEEVEAVVTDQTGVTTEEFYGEDQEDGQRSKWERTIPLDRIRPNPFQPRKTFNPVKIDELAYGMKEHGWIGGGLPVRAHATEPNIYELVWGERRWRAAKIADLKTIPCVVSTYSDDDMIEKGLLENIQREDLSNLEEGQAYVNLLALRDEQGKPRYSIRRLAQRIGKDKSYIEDRLQYARVPIDVQQLATDQPDISPRIIRELGELSKILQPEERAPVIEGVRDGRLRIEDVREIRKDAEQQIENESTVVIVAQQSAPVEPSEPSIERRSESTTPPVTAQVSVATDTSFPSIFVEEQRVGEVSQEPVHSASTQPAPLTKRMVVSVFEKTLKRDNEALERIFRRITDTYETLTNDEQDVLRRYVQRWNTTIQDLMSRME
jgi:ParB family chromosome partitioning protein